MRGFGPEGDTVSPVVHYVSFDCIACAYGRKWHFTMIPKLVTCKRCRRTEVWREAQK